MYLQSLDQQSAAAADNRRRYPRVKPDRFGRLNFEELTPVSFDIRSLLPALKNPRLLAVGGVIVGTVFSAVIAIAVVGQPGAAVAVVTTGEQDQVPVAVALPQDASALPIPVAKVEIKTPAKEPLGSRASERLTEAIPLSRPSPEEREAAVQPDTRDIPPPSDGGDKTAVLVTWPVDAGSLVVMSSREDDGALAVMPGPESSAETAALLVIQ